MTSSVVSLQMTGSTNKLGTGLAAAFRINGQYLTCKRLDLLRGPCED
jgi:hypothetical protein